MGSFKMSSSFAKVGPEWQENSPGRFERGWDAIEKAANEFRNNGIFDLVVFKVKIDITGEDFIDSARKAWIALRYQHPSIAAKQDIPRRCWVYQTPKDEDLTQWVDSTLKVMTDIDADAYLNNTELTLDPTLLVFPKTSELVLQSTHNYLDGPGGVSLMSVLVANIADPPNVSFGAESMNLSVGLSTLIGKKEVTEEDEARAKELSQKDANAQPSLGLPYRAPAANPRVGNPLESRRTIHLFTLSQTQELIKACKALGITPTHAYHAALIKTTQNMAGEEHEKFSNSQIVSWRDRAIPEYASRSQGLGSSLLACGFPFTVIPGTKTFAEIAQEMKQIYCETRDDKSLAGAYTPYHLAREDGLVNMRNTPKDELPIPPATPVVSSWGLLEKLLPRKIGTVEVMDFEFGISQSKSPAPCTFLWTFRDRMTITVCWKPIYTNEKEMNEFVKGIVTEMSNGLGVKI